MGQTNFQYQSDFTGADIDAQLTYVKTDLKDVLSNHEAELAKKPNKTEVLTKDNTEAFAPKSDYNPATKMYVDNTAYVIEGRWADSLNGLVDYVDKQLVENSPYTTIDLTDTDVETLEDLLDSSYLNRYHGEAEKPQDYFIITKRHNYIFTVYRTRVVNDNTYTVIQSLFYYGQLYERNISQTEVDNGFNMWSSWQPCYAPLDEAGKIPVEYLYNNDNPETVTYTTYGVSIDLSNSNPETSVTYTDDAVGMNGGSPAWYKMSIFDKIKPCLFKDGKVVGYLNPDNFAQFSDGSDADITSGDAGDVMIEIPKIGYKISKIGTTLTVHITDEPNKEGFSYRAHTRTTTGDRDKLYVGAFLGSKVSGKLCSLSEKTPHSNENIIIIDGYVNAKGLGYGMLSFYPLILLQCLYLIVYKNLDSQSALGMGYVNGSNVKNTGATIDKGMSYGTADDTEQMKFLGIEDFWGNLNQFIHGCYIDDNAHLLVATDSFDPIGGEGYADMGEISPYSIGGYMSEPQGNNNAGFMVRNALGSSSTYFSDYALVGKNRIPVFGGCYVHGDAAGVFRINMIAPYNKGIYFGARLMYL